jgi:hypothetical protein
LDETAAAGYGDLIGRMWEASEATTPTTPIKRIFKEMRGRCASLADGIRHRRN